MELKFPNQSNQTTLGCMGNKWQGDSYCVVVGDDKVYELDAST